MSFSQLYLNFSGEKFSIDNKSNLKNNREIKKENAIKSSKKVKK